MPVFHKTPVQFVTQEEIDDLEDCNLIHVTTPGWYFWEEVEIVLHGPYDTETAATTAWIKYRDQMQGEVEPPEEEAHIIVMVKDLKDPYSALYLPEDMGGIVHIHGVHIHGLGDASNRPWSDVVRWWPFPSAKDLNFLAELKRQAEGT